MVIDSHRLLLFPPVDSFHRLLIHSIVSEEFPGLKTFSVGLEEDRRTAVCLETLFSEWSPMEQDVEPTGRGYSHPSRKWGHDDRGDAAPAEPVHRERPMNRDDKRSRLKSKRPDQQIYVPRGRRAHGSDVEASSGVCQDVAHENLGQEEKKPRSKAGRGRARASVEPYVPRAKRDGGVSNDSVKDPVHECLHPEQFEDPEHAGDASRGYPESCLQKKNKSKRGRSNSEKEIISSPVDSICKPDEFVNRCEMAPIQCSNDNSEESENAPPPYQIDHVNDSLTANSESVDVFSPSDVKAEVVEVDLIEDEVAEKISDVKAEIVEVDLIEDKVTEKISSFSNAEAKLGASEISQSWPEEDESLKDFDTKIEETIAAPQSIGSPSTVISGDPNLGAEENDDENVSSCVDQKDEVSIDESQDSDQSSDAKPFVIKRENSFIETFESDKTLQLHYSENCHYDEGLERNERAPEDAQATDSISYCKPSSIIDDSEKNDNDCCDTSLNPNKRPWSEKDGMPSENVDQIPIDSLTHSLENDMENAGDLISIPLSNADPIINDVQPSVQDEQSLTDEVKIETSALTDTTVKFNATSDEPKSDKADISLTEVSPNDPVPSVLPKKVKKKERPKKSDVQKEIKETPKEAAVTMETEEDSWDAMFDDDGEALDPSILEELTQKVGKVKIQKPQFDYLEFQPADPELDDETYAHLVEIYDFPSDLITRDLLAAFRSFQDKGFDLKWVDDTHCIGIFSSKIAAQTALELSNPLIKVRPISAASRQTKMKAKKHATSLEPYKPRPVTTAAVARNLVTNALGLTSRVPREKRDEERRKLKEAREKKKEAQQLKIDVWDGKVGRCAMDEV